MITILFYCAQNMCTTGSVRQESAIHACNATSIILITMISMIISIKHCVQVLTFSTRLAVFVRLRTVLHLPALREKWSIRETKHNFLVIARLSLLFRWRSTRKRKRQNFRSFVYFCAWLHPL